MIVATRLCLLATMIGSAIALDSATKCMNTAHKYLTDPRCNLWRDQNETSGPIGMVHIDCFGASWPELKGKLDSLVIAKQEYEAKHNKSTRDHIDLTLFYIDFETITWRQAEAFELPISVIHLTIGHCTNLNLDKFKLLLQPIQLAPPTTSSATTISNGAVQVERQRIEQTEALGLRSLVVCATQVNTSTHIRPWDILLERKFPYLSRLTLSHLRPQLRFTDNRWQIRNQYLDELELDTLNMDRLQAGLFVIRGAS